MTIVEKYTVSNNLKTVYGKVGCVQQITHIWWSDLIGCNKLAVILFVYIQRLLLVTAMEAIANLCSD